MLLRIFVVAHRHFCRRLLVLFGSEKGETQVYSGRFFTLPTFPYCRNLFQCKKVNSEYYADKYCNTATKAILMAPSINGDICTDGGEHNTTMKSLENRIFSDK